MNIDELNGLDEVTRKEVEKLLKVTRERDGDEEYINTQLEIERHMARNGKFELGIKYLKNIKKDDGNIYYKALGFIFIDQYFGLGNLDESYDTIFEFLKDSVFVFDGIRRDAFEVAKECFYKDDYIKALELFELIGGSYSYGILNHKAADYD